MVEYPALPEEQRIRFRIGVNLGDVIVEADDTTASAGLAIC